MEIAMATAHLRLEPQRDLLSQAIVESLKSWPETQRTVFIQLHYGGRSVEEISDGLGMCKGEVIQMLRQCERNLFQALKAFRDTTPREVSQEPPRPIVTAA
jgi:DNA-directed RNA polymerase specialized sigma24 family protein